MNLEELFLKYKSISLDIITAIDKDDLNKLDKLLSERDIIIKEISLKYEDKEKLKRLYIENDLINIDQTMKKEIELSLQNVKQELVKIKKNRQINNTYNTLNATAVYLSKKI